MSGDLGTFSESGPKPYSHRLLKNVAISALGLLVMGLYLLVFRPLMNEVARLDAELERTYQRIAETGFGYSENPEEYKERARSELERMRQLFDEVAERDDFHPGIEELLASPFRVLEFEQRRFNIQQNLKQLAEEGGSSLPPELFAGLPSYSSTSERQELLWLHLEFFNHVMDALLTSGKDLQVDRIESLPIRTLGEAAGAGTPRLELQLRLKVKGSTPSLAAFLNASLPGGKDSGRTLKRKAYSIERLDLRSDTRAGGGHVLLDTLLTGFTLSDRAF